MAARYRKNTDQINSHSLFHCSHRYERHSHGLELASKAHLSPKWPHPSHSHSCHFCQQCFLVTPLAPDRQTEKAKLSMPFSSYLASLFGQEESNSRILALSKVYIYFKTQKFGKNIFLIF